MIEERLAFDEIYMDLACSLAKRSTCVRLHVGCVVTSKDNQRVLAIGYNGSWRGGPNGCDSTEPGNCGCFPPNVKVQMKDGLKRIQDIEEGDLVFTHLNRYRPVTKLLKRDDGHSRKFVVMKIHGGQRFTSTVDHPVRVRKIDGTLAWQQAGSLNVGDVVLFRTKPCDNCGRLIPNLRKTCYRCFRDSSKGNEFRARASKRMKSNNPMKKLYSKPGELVSNDTRVLKLVEKQKTGQKKLEKKLFEIAKKLEERPGYKAIVVDHTRVIPDIILIDWEKRKATAYEYERMARGVRHNKYDGITQYDDIVWHVEQRWDETEIVNGFACLPIKSLEVKEQRCPIYNLEVEDDNSYVCQNVVVHNCIHAEQNALIKLNYNEPCFKRLYTTVSPCSTCAKFIVNAGINEVVFLEKYRTTKGLEILEAAGILYRQLEVKGNVQVDEDKEAGGVRVELRASPIQSIGQIAACEILDPPPWNRDPVQDRSKKTSLLSRLADHVFRWKKSP